MALTSSRTVPSSSFISTIFVIPSKRGFQISSFSTTPDEPTKDEIELRKITRPTLAEAEAMPREYCELGNLELMQLSETGAIGAIEERLIREIMAVHKVSWEDAQPIFDEVEESNVSFYRHATMPHKVGIAVGLTCAFASFPMVFSLDTALWFNEHYVTTDVPKDEDLETWLEVGSWTWAWMEPPLGQISFFLLCLAWVRSQMVNIGATPFTARLKEMRAQKLIERYPEYHSDILKKYSVASFSKVRSRLRN